MYRENQNCSCQSNKIIKVNDTQRCNDDKCACGFQDASSNSAFPQNYMFGQSYVPIQYINTIFKPEIGLKMGTIFPELVSPYDPGQSLEENCYLRRITGNEGKCPGEMAR